MERPICDNPFMCQFEASDFVSLTTRRSIKADVMVNCARIGFKP
jgi:hypothetical protein